MIIQYILSPDVPLIRYVKKKIFSFVFANEMYILYYNNETITSPPITPQFYSFCMCMISRIDQFTTQLTKH